MGGSGSGYSKTTTLTKDDMKKGIDRVDSDSYLFDVEYEKLKKEREELEREYTREREQYLRITEELRQEMSEGTASEADMARFMSVLSDRGVQLQQQQEKMQKSIDDLMNQQADVERRMDDLRKNAFSGATSAYQNANRDYEGFKFDSQKSRYASAKIVEMRPEEYLRRVAFDFQGSGITNMVNGLSAKEVEKYMRNMVRGTKYSAPSLNYKGQKTSGAEKALAALLNGYQRIPVMILE